MRSGRPITTAIGGWLVVTAALIFLVSVLNSWMACHAFRMEAWGMHRTGGRQPDVFCGGMRLG